MQLTLDLGNADQHNQENPKPYGIEGKYNS